MQLLRSLEGWSTFLWVGCGVQLSSWGGEGLGLAQFASIWFRDSSVELGLFRFGSILGRCWLGVWLDLVHCWLG